MFHLAKAAGLTVEDWQDVIFVNQTGRRFWNEADGSYKFFARAMAYSGDPGKLNGGGPIWAIFDADPAAREKEDPKTPQVDPDRFLFRADTTSLLARKISNPLPRQPDCSAAEH